MNTKASITRTTCPNTIVWCLKTACAARLLPLLLLLALPSVLQAQYNYTTNNGMSTITKYTGSGGAVTIPSTINGLPVTSIGDNAFNGCTSLTSVTIPNSVTSIGNNAFSWCPGLTSVTIPNSVTNIGNNAFNGCTGLTSVTIPNSVTSIGNSAFYFCPGLTSVTIPASVTRIEDMAFGDCTSLSAIMVDTSNIVYSSVAGVLFNKSQTTLIQCPSGKGGSYTIPGSVTSIGSSAFWVCGGLTSLTIPGSVTSIGHSAFGYCTSLTSLTIPASVASIGSEVFYFCTSLTGVYFQGNVPSVGSGLFNNANNATVYYLAGTTGWGPTFGGRPTMLWNQPEQNYTYEIINGTITITKYTGSGGAVTIPSTIDGLPVTSIGYQAFYYCTNLTSVTIPNSVTSIGDWAFYWCPSLTSVTIPSSVTSIGYAAFYNCTSLTSVTIPSSVTSIGNQAFSSCISLAAITVDELNSVYSSTAGVLFNKSQTTLIQYPGGKAGSYTIPSSVTSIGIQAFYCCLSLTSVTIPSSVTSIGNYAFYWCPSLTSVTIPSSVTGIGNYAFANCPSLAAITVDEFNSVYSSMAGVLFNKSRTALIQYPAGKAGSYTIPSSVSSIGNYAFQNCTSLTSVTIPSSVSSIGNYAFCCGCSSLTGVYFQGNGPSLGGSGVFSGANNAIVYYLPGTTGYGTTFGGRPAVLWNPQGLPLVTPSAGANGSISPNTIQMVNSGGSMSFTASPNVGYVVDQWFLDGSVVQTGDTSYTLSNIQANHSVQVTFTYGPPSWPVLGHDMLHTGLSQFDEMAFGTLKWSYNVGEGGSSVVIAADGTLYIGSGAGALCAIDPGGVLKWCYQTGDGVSSSPAIGTDGTIYVGSTDDYLYALNPDGTLKWRYRTGAFIFSSSPTIATDGTVYVGSYDGYLYALNPDGTLKWRYQTNDTGSTSPAVGTDGTIYVGSYDGYFYALNPGGTLKWRYPTGNRTGSSPAIDANGTIFVGSGDYYLYALNPDGSLKWRYQTRGSIYSSPAIGADGTIYVGSQDRYLYALNPDGSLNWRYQTGDGIGSSPAIDANGTIFVGSGDYYLYALNPDGSLKWRYQTGGSIYSSPAIGADGTVYVESVVHSQECDEHMCMNWNENYIYAFNLGNKGVVTGRIIDMSTNQGFSASVSTGTSNAFQASFGGYYYVVLDPGTHQVTISQPGYQTMSISSIVVKAGDVRHLDILVPTTGPLNLTRNAFIPANAGESYMDRAWVAGGTYPYVFSVTYGTLPRGCTLDTVAGFITGTPTTTGSYTFAIGVRDQQNAYSERGYTIDVTAPLAFTATALPRATKNTLYFYDLPITGGLPAYTVIKESGSLLTGLTLSTTGRLTGTPTNTGSATFTAKVTDAAGRTLRQNFSLPVDNPLSISISNLNTGITGQPYNQTLQGTGGYGTYTWSVYSGVLPLGINLDASTGILSGTPQTPATMPLVIMVEDSVARQAFNNLTLIVTEPLAFVTTTLPNGAKNETYSDQVRISGGLTPYQFTYAGALPTGLSLNQTNGVISGTPTAAMLNNIEITVTDSSLPTPQTVTAALAIRVTSTLTINSPAVLPPALLGQAISPIVLRAVSGISPYQWFLTGGNLPPGISLAAATGQMTGTPTAAGDFVFTITVTDSKQPMQTATKEFIYHVVDVQPPVLTITAPTEGQVWSNAVFTVNGKVTDNGPVAAVNYQLNGGAWNPAQTANAWSNWTAMVTPVAGTNTVRAYAVDAAGNRSLTNSVNFTRVVTAPLIVQTNGNGTVLPNYNGQMLEVGKSYSMTATAATGFIFTNWTGSVPTNGATVNFIMATNLVLTANFVDIQKPTISITNVAKTYTNSQTVTLSATASDNVGIAKVEFYDGAIMKGSDSVAAYTYDWSFTGVDNGAHVWTARAYDAAGNSRTSSPVVLTLSIDITPPTVVIVSPTNGANFTTSTVTISGKASDPGLPSSGLARVEVRVNGGSWTNATGTAIWTRSVALSPCENIIEARSLDKTGSYSVIASNIVIYTAPNTVPNWPINVSPASGATGVSLTPTLQASAFIDSDCVGDTHAASQWQVLNSAGAIVVADSGTNTMNLTNWIVPTSKLYYGSNYQWRVRYRDNRNGWSSNSTPTTFITGGPLLVGTSLNTSVVLKWPTNAFGFTLQWSTNLGTLNWSNAVPLPVIVSGQYTVTNSMTNNARYYRLRK